MLRLCLVLRLHMKYTTIHHVYQVLSSRKDFVCKFARNIHITHISNSLRFESEKTYEYKRNDNISLYFLYWLRRMTFAFMKRQKWLTKPHLSMKSIIFYQNNIIPDKKNDIPEFDCNYFFSNSKFRVLHFFLFTSPFHLVILDVEMKV